MGMQEVLWENINKFEFDDPRSSFTFSDRLSRENGWSTEYSLRAILEYKKFMFLLCITHHPLTPSEQVDQVWHLHLLYTRSYWNDFCRNTLKKEIHHEPTKGGNAEDQKFVNWYEFTKDLYLKVFKNKPPQDLWPSSETRFKEINFQRINLNKFWVIKRFF